MKISLVTRHPETSKRSSIGWQSVGLLQNHRYMMDNQIAFDYIPAFDGMNKNYCTFIISASIVLIIYRNQVVRPIFKVNQNI